MAITKYPKFGTTGGFSQITEDTRLEQSELVVSNSTVVFQRSKVKECTFVKSSCYWGLEYDGNYIIDTVTVDISDEIDPAYTAREPGVQSQTELLVKLDCCKIIRGHVNIVIEGKGDPSEIIGEIGSVSTPPFLLTTAIGNFSVNTIINYLANNETVNNMFVADFRLEEKESDWESFHVEYKLTVNPTDGASIVYPLIQGENIDMIGCEMDGPHCNAYRINYGLFSREFARVTATMTKYPLIS